MAHFDKCSICGHGRMAHRSLDHAFKAQSGFSEAAAINEAARGARAQATAWAEAAAIVEAAAGLDCGADYCVDPGNCAKHDAKEVSGDNYARDPEAPKTWDVREEAVRKVLAAAAPGERYTFTLTNGMTFEGTFEGVAHTAPERVLIDPPSEITVRPAMLEPFRTPSGLPGYAIPLFKLDGMTKLQPGPADPQIRGAIELAERAIKVLRGEIAPAYEHGSDAIAAALSAAHTLIVAANAARLAASILRGALLLDRRDEAALRGSSEPVGALEAFGAVLGRLDSARLAELRGEPTEAE